MRAFRSALLRRSLFALGFVAGLANATASPPPVRILPLGDSITYGYDVPGGYRLPLCQLLTNAGYNMDFIGTQTGNGVAGLPDSDYEGHSEWTIHGINSITSDLLASIEDPDVILLLIGVNDYNQHDDDANAHIKRML